MEFPIGVMDGWVGFRIFEFFWIVKKFDNYGQSLKYCCSILEHTIYMFTVIKIIVLRKYPTQYGFVASPSLVES